MQNEEVYSEHTPMEQKQHKKNENDQWRLLSLETTGKYQLKKIVISLPLVYQLFRQCTVHSGDFTAKFFQKISLQIQLNSVQCQFHNQEFAKQQSNNVANNKQQHISISIFSEKTTMLKLRLNPTVVDLITYPEPFLIPYLLRKQVMIALQRKADVEVFFSFK